MTYTLEDARKDFDYIFKSIQIATGRDYQRGLQAIDQGYAAAMIKAEKAMKSCDNATRDRETNG